jgi:hypothetical protein
VSFDCSFDAIARPFNRFHDSHSLRCSAPRHVLSNVIIEQETTLWVLLRLDWSCRRSQTRKELLRLFSGPVAVQRKRRRTSIQRVSTFAGLYHIIPAVFAPPSTRMYFGRRTPMPVSFKDILEAPSVEAIAGRLVRTAVLRGSKVR